MSANASVAGTALRVRDAERAHRARLICGCLLMVALLAGLALYGRDYYGLGAGDRPFSAKHALLKPSGRIGIKLGFLGFAMLLAIFLYPLRKRWTWLLRQGSSKHWLDIHILLGLSAPMVIAFHSSFKFQGLAGMAFWIMAAVALSGVVGRYLYAQIPHNLDAAETSRKELQELQERLSQQLQKQNLLPEASLRTLLRLPSARQVQELSLLTALAYMVALDVTRAFRVAALRRAVLARAEQLSTLGGILPTRHTDLERAIAMGRDEAALSKRILFLSRAQQVFHLWHIVHKPFSFSLALLVLIHILVVLSMGYF